jgi:MYXO-CTERM domain-containing protein
MRILAALLLAVPTLAQAEPLRPGFSIEDGFARQALPATHQPAGAIAQSRIIYLNHTGVVLRPGNNDSTTNTSSIPSQQVAIPAWNTDAQTWADTVSCFKDLWSRFDVQVVDADPGNVPHIEAIFGGTPDLVGLPSNVGGVSPFTTDCSIIENSIVFTFTGAIPNISARQACEIMAQEVAHSYGLDHELLASDPMTYLSYNGNRAFQDQAVSCGEYSSRACGINGSTCRANQNSVQLLLARVGTAGDLVAPTLSWTSPSDGETVMPGFAVDATGTDNVAVTGATLTIDGTVAGSEMGAGPFSFSTSPMLAAGTHTLKLEITDGRNVQSQTRTVTVSAQAGSDTGGGTDPGTGGGTDPNGGGANDPNSGITGGCSTGGGAPGLLLVVVGLGLAVFRRRR